MMVSVHRYLLFVVLGCLEQQQQHSRVAAKLCLRSEPFSGGDSDNDGASDIGGEFSGGEFSGGEPFSGGDSDSDDFESDPESDVENPLSSYHADNVGSQVVIHLPENFEAILDLPEHKKSDGFAIVNALNEWVKKEQPQAKKKDTEDEPVNIYQFRLLDDEDVIVCILENNHEYPFDQVDVVHQEFKRTIFVKPNEDPSVRHAKRYVHQTQLEDSGRDAALQGSIEAETTNGDAEAAISNASSEVVDDLPDIIKASITGTEAETSDRDREATTTMAISKKLF